MMTKDLRAQTDRRYIRVCVCVCVSGRFIRTEPDAEHLSRKPFTSCANA